MNDFFETRWNNTQLDTNYWNIVGIPTEKEFHEIAKYKLHLLESIGFNYNSDILDVGCGTGLIPSVIYSQMNGMYSGCDISEKAIDFCAKKYTKNNFKFFVSQQTDISCPSGVFDFVVFYSVFTHCHPSEIKSLFAQAKKLLKPSGKILADFFIGKYDGDQRYISAISEDDFADCVSLPYQILSHQAYKDGIERRLVVFKSK